MKWQCLAVAIATSLCLGNAYADDAQKTATKPQMEDTLLSSNMMLGATIYGTGDKAVADINSVVLDKQGKAQFVIAGVGGVAGVGESEIVIPWKTLQCRCTVKDGNHSCHAQIPMTAEQLKAAPQLQAKNYSELTDKEWLNTNAKFYSASPPTAIASPGELVCVKSVTDAAVKGQGDADLGELDALIFDMHKGQVVYGIIGHDGVAGVGETYTAVPFKALHFNHRDDDTYTVTTSLTTATLKANPSVTPKEYPELQLKSVREKING